MKSYKMIKAAIVIIIISLFACPAYQTNAATEIFIKGTTLWSYQGKDSIIIVPKRVKTIGKKAFANNKKIQQAVLKKGVKTIEAAAFKNCEKLKTVEIPATVKKIAVNAFYGCKKITIIAPKGSYASKFAKRNGIFWKRKQTQKEENRSFYGITGIKCYWYTAGTYPCIAQKKIITDTTKFDSIYETLLLLNSGKPAKPEDQIAGGKVLRVQIDFSDKESRTIECNEGIYMEEGIVNKLAENSSSEEFWNSIDCDIIEETL